MALLDLLIPKEKIFGLEIQKDRIRAVLLYYTRKGVVTLVSSNEIKLPKGTIIEGEVKDKKVLAQTLKKLLRSARPSIKTPYCIISLPESLVFARTFSIFLLLPLSVLYATENPGHP